MKRRHCLTLLVALGVLARPASARSLALARFFGAYVGTATLVDEESGRLEERDLDLLIAPFRRFGFRLRTISVTLVEGRRDRPGVVRRESEAAFVPAQGRPYFVEERSFSPFRAREELQPMAGDPVRWATVDETGLHLWAFVLLEDGRYELQATHRYLVPDGLELAFARFVEGRRVRHGRGRLVRVG